MKLRTPIVVIAILVAIAGALIGLRALARARTFQLFGTLVARVPTEERRVALTFDDGPTTARVDTILRILAARDVRATFFVIGRDLEDHMDAGRKLVAAGHELGNHSYSHPRLAFVGFG